MANLNTIIGKYRVTLDTDMGDGATGCWIQYNGFSGSLELADALGGIEDANDQRHMIPAPTLRQIREWAERNGY